MRNATKRNVHIGGPTKELCRRLGVDPKTVAKLELTPRHITATVFVLNEQGNKYLEHGEPVTKTIDYPAVYLLAAEQKLDDA